MKKIIKKIFGSRLKLISGSRFTSFLFIVASMMIAAGILFGANMYYNIDTSEVVVQEIQRVTNVIRATAGLIVGGIDNQNPTTGYKLEVVGDSLFSGTTMIGNVSNNAQELRFLEGGAAATQYVGLKAPSGLTTDRAYILPHHDTYAPSDNMVLTWKSGNELRWQTMSGIGAGGDITAVGSMDTGDVFAGTGAHNQWLGLGSGAGRIAFVDGTTDYVNILDANVGIGATMPNYKLDVLGAVRTGGPGTSGQLRIYSEQEGTDYEVIFGPSASMTMNTSYTLPPNVGTHGHFLMTDGNGNLTWQSTVGSPGGGVGGSGTANTIAKWTGASTLGNSSIIDSGSLVTIGNPLTLSGTGSNLTVQGTGISTFAGSLTIGGTLSGVTAVLSTSVTSPLYTGTGAVTISSGGAGDIILNPASGAIQIATGDVIRTPGGHPIRASGEQILREVIPIFGFDLPARCSSSCENPNWATISRVIEDYPFPSAMTGTTRIHKFIIRYADTMASGNSTWRVWNVTGNAQHSSFNVPASSSTSLDSGNSHITGAVSIPINTDDWRLDVQLPANEPDFTLQVFQVFLAAYDQLL